MSTDAEYHWHGFLSHSRSDQDVVREIANRLKSDGMKVWFDNWAIQVGDHIPSKIEEGLEHSRVLVLCLSTEALATELAAVGEPHFSLQRPAQPQPPIHSTQARRPLPKGSLAQFSYIVRRSEQHEYRPVALATPDFRRNQRVAFIVLT
jgi:hypothetical protein